MNQVRKYETAIIPDVVRTIYRVASVDTDFVQIVVQSLKEIVTHFINTMAYSNKFKIVRRISSTGPTVCRLATRLCQLFATVRLSISK